MIIEAEDLPTPTWMSLQGQRVRPFPARNQEPSRDLVVFPLLEAGAVDPMLPQADATLLIAQRATELKMRSID
jgi:hypothetical protein